MVFARDRRTIFVGSLFILAALLAVLSALTLPKTSRAQGSTDVFLTPGESQLVALSLPDLHTGTFEALNVYREDGGSLGGFEFLASALTDESCSFNLSIRIPQSEGDPLAEQNFTGPMSDWGPWSIADIPDWVTYVSVIVRVNADCQDELGVVYLTLFAEGPPATATNTNTPTQEIEDVYIDFWADDDFLNPGECTWIHWYVEGDDAVYLEDSLVNSSGDASICPNTSYTYTLDVLGLDGFWYYADLPISLAATPTRTPTPSRTPTPFPSRTPTRVITRTPSPAAEPARSQTPRPTQPQTPPAATSIPTIPPTFYKILVVTNSAALNDILGPGAWNEILLLLNQRYGSDGYDLVDLARIYPYDGSPASATETDAAISQQWGRDRYWAIFIVGGSWVVSDAKSIRRVGDEPLISDDYYSDMDGDWIPDAPLARLPDGGSLEMMRTQLMGAGRVGQSDRFYVDVVDRDPGRAYADAFVSPDGVSASFAYFGLSGFRPQNDAWAAARPGSAWFDIRIDPGSIPELTDVVISEAGFGAAYCPGDPCTENSVNESIALAFLQSGTLAYMANSNPVQQIRVGYADGTSAVYGIPEFTRYYLGWWRETNDPFMAYFWAKNNVLGNIHARGRQSPGYETQLDAVRGLSFFGVPEPRTYCYWCIAQCPSGKPADCDGDGLDDRLEHQLVERFKPELVFDSRESPLDISSMKVFWQVSPVQWGIKVAGNAVRTARWPIDPAAVPAPPEGFTTHTGVFITFVMAWPYDLGPLRFDPVGMFDELACGLGGVFVGSPEIIGRHCGDSEGLRYFVEYTGPPGMMGNSLPYLDWELTHIDWKRHSEGFFDGEDPVPLDQIQDLEFVDDHPVLYVSGNKHAMYPNTDECDSLVHCESGCCAYIDSCWPGLIRGLANTPFTNNVGEHVNYGFELLGSIRRIGYPGEQAWSTDAFCGGQDYCIKVETVQWLGSSLPTCSGAMGNIWWQPKQSLAP